MRTTSWRAFLGLIFRPFNKAWSVVGVGLPGAVALLLWGTHHPLWALFVALGTLLALSVIAGYRLQRRVNDFAAKSGTIDSLGRQLDLGRFHPLSLELEGEAFQRDWTAFAETLPTKDEAEEWLEARPHTAIDDTHEWARNVRQLLNKYVGSSFAARFDNDAGLLPGSPPEELSDKWYVGVWQSHDMRMQRLHQIIEELTERLTAGT